MGLPDRWLGHKLLVFRDPSSAGEAKQGLSGMDVL